MLPHASSTMPRTGRRARRPQKRAPHRRVDAGPSVTHAALRQKAPNGAEKLLEGDGSAGGLELLLGGLGVILLGALEDGLRGALDDLLGLLQAKAGELADDLDDGDLVVAEAL